MAAFRRCLIALAVLAIFASLASAQTPTPMSCSLNSFPNTIRLEGKTDQVGDLTILCSGGSVPTAGAALPLVNFTVQLSQNITSRCTNTLVAGTCPNGVSDALLMIDEPGTGGGPVGGFGPNQAATVCATPTTGCSAPFAALVGGTPVMSSSSSSAVNTAPNTYQGIVSLNTVTFFGIPLLAPQSTTGTARIFRITNIRSDSTSKSANTPVAATITFTGTNVTSLISLNQNSANVAVIQNGLDPVNTKVAVTGTQPICVTQGYTAGVATPLTSVNISTLNFVENFGAAFKTRLQPNATTGSSVSNNTALQNLPGTYASESGVTITGLNGTATTVGGLADYATRLKASFANIPSGVRIFVSTTNLIPAATVPATYQTPANIGTNLVTSFAQLLSTSSAEGVVDGATGPVLAATAPTTGTPGTAEIPISGGSGTAMWEVFNSNPTSNETFAFNVYMVYTANTVPVTGAAGTVPTPTVNMTYALGVAGGVPQMADTAGRIQTLFNLTNCRTILMFPFVSGAAPYDTGMAISNTSLDAPVFATPTQAGACVISFYPVQNMTPTGTTVVGTAVPAFTTPTIVAGTTYANLASVMAGQGFNGYALAACNFQYAHGFAYVADYGNPNTSSAMGYLALTVPDVGVKGTRGVTAIIGINEGLIH